MNRRFQLIFALILLLAFRTGSRAADPPAPDPWSRLLDRYELICRRSIELKQRKEAGLSAPAGEMLSLMDELARLRAEIGDASDRMPASARSRFETIREMYATGVVVDTRPIRLAPGLLPLPVRAECRLPASGISPYTALRNVVRPGPAPRPSWTVAFSPQVAPEFSPGFSVAYGGRKLGAYAAFRSSFSFHRTAYDVLSDGRAGSARIWTTGRAATDRLFLTAGPVVRLTPHISLSAGLGFGLRRLCWEDTEGDWARVRDASRAGLCLEAGAAYTFRRVTLAAGWLTLPFAYHGLTLSAGYTFR